MSDNNNTFTDKLQGNIGLNTFQTEIGSFCPKKSDQTPGAKVIQSCKSH